MSNKIEVAKRVKKINTSCVKAKRWSRATLPEGMAAVFLMIQENVDLDRLFAANEFVPDGGEIDDDEVTEVYV
jgi:hypothetical protein